MPVLPSWGTHRVYGSWGSLVNPGQLLPGTVSAILPVDVHNVPQDIIIPKGRHINAQALNTTAGLPSLDIEVPASDDPDNLPTDFYIEIVVQLTEPRVTYTYKIPTPLGGETNLRTILDPTSVTVDGPLFVGVPGGLAQLSSDGLSVLNADGDPISTGGGTPLTSYDQVSSLADYPATFPAAAHQHTAAQISDATTVGRSVLQAADATAARTAINAAAISHNHSGTYQPVGDYATLVGGVIPTSQIPALALTSTNVVASQAAMLALSNVQTGDIAVRTDGAGTFILSGANPAQIGSWTLLSSPTDAVTSVNGQTGTVTLSAADVGAAATSHTHSAANVTSGTFDTARIPSLPASQVTSGTFDAARLTPGSTLTVLYSSGWPTRPTARTDVAVIWLDPEGVSVDGGTVVTSPTNPGPLDMIVAGL